MKRPIKAIIAVFVALGAMISFSPRDTRVRLSSAPDEAQQGIERHFVAVWDILGNAVARNEE
ncbi:hypothetical protein [Desulfovibrio sp. ZJ369]|uniref:hypothetical protein n=1 Tax=Desulfovibrio sp. ZJ369 TaxID=2709793 RepID=UPI0013EC1555|nr:hypothetical protein [Desulfovibrio sp. ZJ369]